MTDWTNIATAQYPQPIGSFDAARFSLIALAPKTGRKHQLRRHLAHLRHPILGDTTHGDGKQNKYFKAHLAELRLMLHATQLQFVHPYTGQAMNIVAPLPHDFTQVCDKLGWHDITLNPIELVDEALKYTSST